MVYLQSSLNCVGDVIPNKSPKGERGTFQRRILKDGELDMFCFFKVQGDFFDFLFFGGEKRDMKTFFQGWKRIEELDFLPMVE